MQDLLSELLLKKGLFLKKFKTIQIKKFSKLKSYKIYYGVDKNGYHTLVYVRDAKSKFILKNAQNLQNLHKLIENSEDKIIKKKILFYNSDICSKAKENLKNDGWRIYAFM